MAPDQRSPYSALSGMAIDPIYLSLDAIPDFAGAAALDADLQQVLSRVRQSTRVDYADVRRLKRAGLGLAFEAFHEREWQRDSARAHACRAFIASHAWWLNDYALFRALHEREQHRPWTAWPAPLQSRSGTALANARRELADEILFYQYVQWAADEQWRRARDEARLAGVSLLGDLPFLLDVNSADVWARVGEFDLDVSVGVPPDAFSADGQDWGTPMPRWDVMASNGYQWLRDRARRNAELYDGYRVDHLVGFYRTYGRPRQATAPPFFSPAGEDAQEAQGERLLGVFREPGAEIIAEDLGTVPDFVRASLTRLGIPGYRVLRWERRWHEPGQPFIDPAAYPASSVATSGTHDTEPLAIWWASAADDERRAMSVLPTLQRLEPDVADLPWNDRVRDVFVEALYASGSDLVLLPIGDVFGWPDRINDPASLNDHNWRFMLPWRVDTLEDQPDACERQTALKTWAARWNR
jgi:4-alpha-glucanotransferase